MSGVIAISDAIPIMGALEKLLMAHNGLLTKEAGKVLADMLKENSKLKELDLSNSGYSLSTELHDGPGFAQELAAGVSANGALTSLNVSNNVLTNYGRDMSGVQALAAAIPKCR